MAFNNRHQTGSDSNFSFKNSSNNRGGRGFRSNRRRFSRGRKGSQKSLPKIDYQNYKHIAKPIDPILFKADFKFVDLDIHKFLKRTLLTAGFEFPTEIQNKAIPAVMQGSDILGLADTGTGKTLSFLLPLTDRCLRMIAEKKPWQCLILAPTRELAEQIESELLKITNRRMRIFSTSLVGGKPINRQIYRLKKFNHFLIATPGRCLDLINRNVLKFENCQAVVLDEMDRMLDMGFVEDIKTILSHLPEVKQNLFFSATANKQAEKLALDMLSSNVVKVNVNSQQAGQNVHQDVVFVNKADKFEVLLEILKREECEKAIIFSETKSFTERLYLDLKKQGFPAESIHGDKSTFVRSRSLNNFKNGRAKILVATDVAARGVDVKDITHIINYDEPRDIETYTHRIGRAGRIGNVGWAFTFVEKKGGGMSKSNF